MRRYLVGFGESASSIGLTVAAACLIIIVAINGANVVARYVFHAPFSWAEAAMVFVMITGIFWGAIAVAWRQIDICIDAFVNLTHGRARATLQAVARLTSIVILCSLCLVSSRVTYQLYKFGDRNDALNLPVWIPNAAFAVGVLFVILMMVARLFAPANIGGQLPDLLSGHASEKNG